MPLMGQYNSGSLNPAQFPSGGVQPNPPQYYKVNKPTDSKIGDSVYFL